MCISSLQIVKEMLILTHHLKECCLARSVFLLPVKNEIPSPKKLMFARYNTGSLFKISFTHSEGIKLVYAAVNVCWFGSFWDKVIVQKGSVLPSHVSMDLYCPALINIKCGEKVKTQEIGSGNLCFLISSITSQYSRCLCPSKLKNKICVFCFGHHDLFE